MRENGKLDYLEMPARLLPVTKLFYEFAFGWKFTDYGPTYSAFEGAGLDGGLDGDPAEAAAKPLPVVYADALETMLDNVKAAGGTIVKPIYSFPGGRRFHFTDPSGNELAVWSESLGVAEAS